MREFDIEAVLGISAGMLFIVMSLAIPIVYILARERRQRRAMEQLHAERMAAIERGMELTPNSPEPTPAMVKPARTALLPGLVWFLIGLAINASFGIVDHYEALVIGLIPTAIGLAYLIYYFIEERKHGLDRK